MTIYLCPKYNSKNFPNYIECKSFRSLSLSSSKILNITGEIQTYLLRSVSWYLTTCTSREKKHLIGGSRTAATSKMERFVIIVNGFQKENSGKHLCRRVFLKKSGRLKASKVLKNRLLHKCFPVSFARFLRTYFLQNVFVGCF